ncbi:hypothetical protein B1B04_08470 [Lysinibacillus sp. KCTC 33748]|uniref:hypothetical protein n=1 Tax=unclassified Lysinibacillus TaxID=2636778 RepID=UPI0009A8B716|nr:MULTISPECIES: hypothetical protein [unclassified Lysinibacillus]OXS74912.1 hypothetical protein B1B04_08470 [Lysinibacillus sp. KCTC 33748]SKB59833.1 hypothetical protein SAMN06295926_104177 [Lysinibacillus sp. AC-3]
MSKNIQIRNITRIPQLKKVIKDLNSYAVEVGIFGDGEYVMIARVHEFGMTIRTKKANINIPERSFMRSVFEEKQDAWTKFVKKRLPLVLDSKLDVRILCEDLGAKMVGDIQEKIVDLDTPPNAQSTIDQKGSSNPLINKGGAGGLLSKITYRVVKK